MPDVLTQYPDNLVDGCSPGTVMFDIVPLTLPCALSCAVCPATLGLVQELSEQGPDRAVRIGRESAQSAVVLGWFSDGDDRGKLTNSR